MIQILVNEWLKFRKSNLIFISIGTIFFAPVLIIITALFINNNLARDGISFYEFLAVSLRVNTSFVAILFYTFLASELIMYEFKNDTFKSQLSIPILRTDFLVGKIALISLAIMTMTLLTFAISVLFAFLIDVNGINIFLIKKFFIAFLKSSFLVMPMAYFSITLVFIFRNVFLPMAFNFIILVVSFSITNLSLYALLPWSAPARILFVASVGNELYVPIMYSYISILVLTTLSFVISFVRINEMEF